MEKKTYTPQQVAINVLKKAQEVYKNSNLCKSESANSAHEIDPGQEPKNDDADCAESLKDGKKKDKKKEGEKTEENTEVKEPTDKVEETKETPAEETKEETEEDKKKKKVAEVAKSEDDIWNTLEKALFQDYSKDVCESKTCKAENTKENVCSDLKWKLEKIKDLREITYIVEREYEKEDPEFFKKIKDIFEKRYAAIKKEIAELVAEYNTLKKSEVVENDLQKNNDEYRANNNHTMVLSGKTGKYRVFQHGNLVGEKDGYSEKDAKELISSRVKAATNPKQEGDNKKYKES
jgi:hypothetical protein